MAPLPSIKRCFECEECGTLVKPHQANHTLFNYERILCPDCEGIVISPHVSTDTGKDWQDTKAQQFQEVSA